MARQQFDSVFLNSRRETFVLVCVFAAFLVWSVGVSYWLGYGTDPMTVSEHLVMGIPGWVFWGVCVPWIAANLFTVWFACCFVANDSLEEVADGLEDKEGEGQP